jgi:hypothetical protein
MDKRAAKIKYAARSYSNRRHEKCGFDASRGKPCNSSTVSTKSTDRVAVLRMEGVMAVLEKHPAKFAREND